MIGRSVRISRLFGVEFRPDDSRVSIFVLARAAGSRAGRGCSAGACDRPACMTRRGALHPVDRSALVRRGQVLSYIATGYNLFEGVASLTAGILAGSISLAGFGVDSLIEVTSSVAALWRLHADVDQARRAHAERVSLRIIGACFVGLALYIAWGAGRALWTRTAPEVTVPGVIIAALSLVVMPILARAKRRVAIGLGSRALTADAVQTDLCMYLSAIALRGLVLNGIFGWWWADPVAALVMVPIIGREGVDDVRGDACPECCSIP